MEISKKLQELQDKAEELFSDAELAQRQFIHMAEAEGLSEREIRKRWLYIVDWGMKERNAELWKTSLLGALDEDRDEIVESMDKLDEELMTYAEPEDIFEDAKGVMVEYDRRLRDAMNTFAAVCADKGMSIPETARTIAKALGRELPAPEHDPLTDDTLE